MGKMALNEAIRLGSMSTVQGRGSLSAFSDTAPCALGAARLAAGTAGCGQEAYDNLRLRFPVLGMLVELPKGTMPDGMKYYEKDPIELMSAIWLLNDSARWTREQIADWVEGIEKSAAEPMVEEVVMAVVNAN